MLEYTNIVSQCLKAYDELKDDNDTDNKQKKAKYVQLIIYLILFVIAVVIAWYYFDHMEGFNKYGLVALAGFLNIPFILFYLIYHVALKKPKLFDEVGDSSLPEEQ